MSKARDLANAGTALTTVSATELGYLDGVTSAVQTQINSKEATLPSQTGNSGKYLTTDGTSKSWGTVSQYALPSQTGQSGKYLSTNGTSELWAAAATATEIFNLTTTRKVIPLVTVASGDYTFITNTGTAIVDVRSNGQTLIGSNAYQGMYDSTGYALMPAPGQTLTIPGYLTSSYNALWFEYFTTSGSYSRAGLFHTSWSGSSIIYTDITSSFLGSVPTNNISFTASFSSSYVQLIASASTNGWLIKGSIRGI